MGPRLRGDDGENGDAPRTSLFPDSNFKQPGAIYFNHAFAISRRRAPEVCCILSPSEVRGRAERRVPDAPMGSCAGWGSRHTRLGHGYTGNIRRSARSGFNGLLRALPGDRHGFLSPSPIILRLRIRRRNRRLDAHAGRQDHTTSPSAYCVAGLKVRYAQRRRQRFPRSCHGPLYKETTLPTGFRA
jgi:hypothetical protein